MSEIAKFFAEVEQNIEGLKGDHDLAALSRIWAREAGRHRYAYNFAWMGRPIIQVPQDMIAMQEILWKVKPDLVVETGVAHGGSILYYASLLELFGQGGTVLGVDVDIRAHNRAAIEDHPMSRRVEMIQGSSIDPEVVAEVKRRAEGRRRVVVVLDSNHTHEHVLAELEAYAPLVGAGSYVVVFDTLIEDLPNELWKDRPWGKGNNPKTAVNEFLRRCDRFAIDRDVEAKLQITVAPGGWLKCTKDPS